MTRIRSTLLLVFLALVNIVHVFADHKYFNDVQLRGTSDRNHGHLQSRAASGEPKAEKYFDEPGGSTDLVHYDSRFFDKEVPYSEHVYVLRDLIRSYLTTLHALGIETWLAHGTLLGWWWNGQIMPWDFDLDVQVSNDTLQWLGDNLNYTEHTFNGTKSAKTYLLDINPYHSEIDKGDGQNIIDARWIDTHNGMFIDITGVRERTDDEPGMWSCKNEHRYWARDLWPMRMSTFEGVRARIPYTFQRILAEEYGEKSLVATEWEGHRWDADLKQWIRMSSDEMAQRKMDRRIRKKAALKAQEAEKQLSAEEKED